VMIESRESLDRVASAISTGAPSVATNLTPGCG
jgi:hypothetical protein